MKVLNSKNMAKSRQRGFTIIELIVVILLLGILTATALPRFLDVTDEAHQAVQDAVIGGLATGGALFRAQWIAEGQPASTVAISAFNNLKANTNGYPVSVTGTTGSLADNTDCLEIFTGLLQEGRPTVAEDSTNVTTSATAITQTNIDAVATADPDFLSQWTAANVCTYAYIRQYDNIANEAVPIITFDVSSGAVTQGTAL